METYEDDMEIAEVSQGFVHLQVICFIFFDVDDKKNWNESLSVLTRSKSALVLDVAPLSCRATQSHSSLLAGGALAWGTGGSGEIWLARFLA